MILLLDYANHSVIHFRCYGNNVNSRLGGGTDTRDGKTDVDGGTDTTEEELGLQEDLTVGDGNDLDKNNQREAVILILNGHTLVGM